MNTPHDPAAESAQVVEPRSDLALLPLVQRFFDQDPVKAAQNLEATETEVAVAVLISLEPNQARRAFVNLGDDFAAEILPRLPEELLKSICGELEPEKAAFFFRTLPQDFRKPFLRCIAPKRRRLIKEFLAYPEGSAGRIMSSRFFALKDSMTVAMALQRVRQQMKKGPFGSYLYVVDQGGHLVGIATTWDLLTAEPEALLSQIARKEVFSVNCFMDREQVAGLMSDRRFLCRAGR